VIADDVVDEANLKISNAGSNGNFLSKQSGDTGGLTWAAIPTLNQDTTGTAAIATTVTVTDNESTAENNLITFVADAGDATGAHGLEMDGNLHYNPNTGTVTATNLAGTLSTAAQGNVTSLGTLTALDVDDINLNSKTITITGDTSDTFTITTGAGGATTMTTTDGGGTAGHFEIAANGNITLDAAGDIALEAAGNDVTVDTDNLKIESSTNFSPVLEVLSTSNNSGYGILKFNKQRADDSPEDGDAMGMISFAGEDALGAENFYGSIICTATEVDASDEAGKIEISVANDGVSRNGITMTGDKDTAEEVDVTIANGAASTTTIAGDLAVTSKAVIPTRKFTVTSSTHFEHQGDVIYFGGGSTTQGDLCYLKEDGEWGQADADGAATGDDADRDATGMLAIALGTDPDVNGMLIRGVITMDYDMGDVANPIYVSTTAGEMTSTAPTANGDFVRIVGYCLDDTNGQIYFNPDNTWVEITA
jgi:hypothetical protein